VAKGRHGLKLGKGSAFVKSRLKRLGQADNTWEADFRALLRGLRLISSLLDVFRPHPASEGKPISRPTPQ
jgi:hypothetical protein